VKKSILLSFTSIVAVAAAGPAIGQDLERDYSTVTDEMLLNPDPGDWLQWRRTVNNWGHSTLDQINRENVGELELAWAWAMAELGQQEVAPIVHDGIMILATNQNQVDALDAATGDLIWSYNHERPEFEGGYHNNQANRQKNSVAFYGDSVILTTVDAKLISLDALSGQVEWEVQVNDWEAGYSFTAGPLIADGKIFTGTSGCSIVGTNGACWITAHDAETGEELWRFNTIDDPNNPAVDDSWNGVPAENRWGASPWTTGAYDAELGIVVYGTGMPIPYPEITRGTGDGDVLYTNSTVALDAETGELVWYYQHLPRDNWDLDSPFERIFLDADVDGEMRRIVLTTPGKNGITFALDAATGEYLWSQETIYQDTITSISEDGEITINEDLIMTDFEEFVTHCPSLVGGRLWQATAYNPNTGLYYLPARNTCGILGAAELGEVAPGNAVGAIRFGGIELAPGAQLGALHVLDIQNGGAAVWDIQSDFAFTSSTLVTDGGLLFVGNSNRYIMALNDETGEELWSTRLNAPIGGYPMTYEVDGVQYVAVPAGQSNQTHANLSPGLGLPRTGGNSVFVFRLPQ